MTQELLKKQRTNERNWFLELADLYRQLKHKYAKLLVEPLMIFLNFVASVTEVEDSINV